MSPNTPRTQREDATPRSRALHTRAAARLCIMVCLALASTLTTYAQSSPTPAPQQSPTPYVRPRLAGPKPEATPTPTATVQAGNAGQQSQEAEEVDEGEVVRVDSNLVIIPASVVDSRGRAITDLRLDDFELRVDGEVKQIGDLSRAETPVHIALLFDNSASLSAAREFEKQAAVRFFQSLVRPIDRAAIYSISTVPTLSQPLTNDVRRLVQTIERFPKPDGATALFDTLSHAADYMHNVVGRKVLVIVSDGTDTVSDTSFDEALNRALRAECQIYVVQTRQIEDPNLHDTFSEQRLLKLTDQTGGAVFAPRSIEELDTAFTQISLDLSQQYLLSYYPVEERKDKYFRFINLRVKTRPQARVRARKGFYPLAPGDHSAPAELAKAHGKFSESTRPETNAGARASAPVGKSNAADSRRKADGAAPKSGRDNVAATRKVGPAGPDEEERARTAPAAAASPELTPTFTITPVARESASTDTTTTTTSTTTAAQAPTPTPSSTSQSLFSASDIASQPPTTTPAASVTPTPAPKPERTPTPAPAPSTTPTTTEEARPKPVVSGGVLNGKALSLPRPTYPQAAKTVGISGTVVVEVTIDEEGRVIEARAVSGHTLLRAAAVSAATSARFTPAKLSGEPVKMTGTISYKFALP